MKLKNSKTVKLALNIATVVVLVLAGVAGTLAYQKTIDNIKAQGASEYKATCQKYANKEGQKWLECDE